MELPNFKRSKTFWEGITADCLVGTSYNSELPGLAVAHRAESGKDKPFNVVLRGLEMTKWQQEMLEFLFKRGGLLVAIRRGLELYQTSAAFSMDDLDQDVREVGLLAHVYLNKVFLDDSRKEVILTLSSIAIGDIDEHGLVIHGSGGAWKFDHLDYLHNYLAEVESPPETKPSVEFTAIDPSPFFGSWKLAKPYPGLSNQDDLAVHISPERISVTMRDLPMIAPGRWTACEYDGKSVRFRTESHELTFRWSDGILGYGDYAMKKAG